MRVAHGSALAIIVGLLASGCTSGATDADSPAPSMPGTAAELELSPDPEANLDIGAREIVVAGGSAGLPGEVSAAMGFGTDVTIHLRCVGDASVELALDGDVVDEAETLCCDGQQHDIEVSLDTSPTTLTVRPAAEEDGGSATWVAAVSTP